MSTSRHPSVRLASRNAIKFDETQGVFPDVSRLSLDLTEIQDTDPRVVVQHKLDQVAALNLDHPVIVEDTALGFHSWNGLPGALIAWFVEKLGPEGIWDLVAAAEDRRAIAVSAVGIVHHGQQATWHDSTEGLLVAPRGPAAGWTSIFEVARTGQTLAEMSRATRHQVTMRRAPLVKAREWLDQVSATVDA
ncbi:non-canonical purine NTP pyrophosphatase [Streptomyces sp. wa1063]|uniref:non-canonical purine NTP pyrophosphatase n=1 Tax=Streptomyces sp. wa1063 TaxID=1828212 RepID=UPI000BF0FA95|nr:non-canonical purine NTP pyrophosphatase [Streptomyces sp. wa1063]